MIPVIRLVRLVLSAAALTVALCGWGYAAAERWGAWGGASPIVFLVAIVFCGELRKELQRLEAQRRFDHLVKHGLAPKPPEPSRRG